MQGKDFTYDIKGGIMMTQKERRVAVGPKKNQPIFCFYTMLFSASKKPVYSCMLGH